MSEQAVTSGFGAAGASADAPIEDAVEIRLPADSAYLSVLRTATAGLAARLDFTLDEIEDLRIAVDEACAMLLPHAIETARAERRFRLDPDTLGVTVTVPTTRGQLPERDTFSWTVLSALAGDVDSGTDDERQVWITLRKRRGAAARHDCRRLHCDRRRRPRAELAAFAPDGRPRAHPRPPWLCSRCPRTTPPPVRTPPSSSNTCHWWSTSPGASAIAASPTTTWSRSPPSG